MARLTATQQVKQMLNSVGILSRIPLFVDSIEIKGPLATIYITLHFMKELEICCGELVCYCPALREEGLVEILRKMRADRPAWRRLSKINITARGVLEEGFHYSELDIDANDFIVSFAGEL
jgi:hypothetical protein